jgi:hypothetical protein
MLHPKDLKPGREQYEEYCSTITKVCQYQYDYRHTDGELFSCVASSLQECRERKNKWLKEKTQ